MRILDRHLNIFHAYRHGNLRDSVRERVLEDNVTRALIITLRSSRLLTREFLKEFVGVNSDGRYKYDLQSRLDDEPEASEGQRFSLRRLLVIARKRRPQIPRSLHLSDAVMNQFESQLEHDPSGVRQRLSALSNRIQEEGIGQETISAGLKRVLRLDHSDGDIAALGDVALPSYLYELTFGSRPDASIVFGQAAVLFENKLHGDVTDVQIRRHLRENFGEGQEPKYFRQAHGQAERNQVPVTLWSWNDVHRFFDELLHSRRLSRAPKSRFLVSQFLEYLEMQGMGQIKFARADFLDWESDEDSDIRGILLDRVVELGEELANELGSHFVKPQRPSKDYIGVNVLHDEIASEPSYQVPHWSLGLDRDRQLRFYVLCEGKKIVCRLLKQRTNLEERIMSALWKACDRSGLSLQVEEKHFVIQGGTGREVLSGNPIAFIRLRCTRIRARFEAWFTACSTTSTTYMTLR